jgi:hypothetical protein
MNRQIAECAGLWLAEGDSKTRSEITFTNNSIGLILYFYKMMKSLYRGKNKSRIYVYSPSERKLFNFIGDMIVRYYYDRRANRTYYIYRLADVKFVKYWHNVVNVVKNDKKLYPDILRGFFAGEGNVKHSIKHHNSRSVRISQKRDKFLEKVLNCLNISFVYEPDHRVYVIGARQLNKLNKMNIAELHPEKAVKFRNMINSVSRMIYPKNYLKIKILEKLDDFYRTKQLADIFKRSDARILDVLRDLKKENKIRFIKLRDGKVYWAKNKFIDNFILNEKIKILKELNSSNSISNMSKIINIPRKTISKRLLMFEKEGLVKYVNKEWVRTEKSNELLIGIDEAGNRQRLSFPTR